MDPGGRLSYMHAEGQREEVAAGRNGMGVKEEGDCPLAARGALPGPAA